MLMTVFALTTCLGCSDVPEPADAEARPEKPAPAPPPALTLAVARDALLKELSTVKLEEPFYGGRALLADLRAWVPPAQAEPETDWNFGSYSVTINLAERWFGCSRLPPAPYRWELYGEFRLDTEGKWSAVVIEATCKHYHR
jgi:hypothetical protein